MSKGTARPMVEIKICRPRIAIARQAASNQRLDRPPTEWRDVLQALRDTSNNTEDWDHLLEALQNDADAVIPGE